MSGGIQESVTSDSPLVILVTALLSGGVGTGITAVWRARKTVPAERDNLIVGSAQTALLSMKDSLAAEAARADRAENAIADRDEKIAARDAVIAERDRQLAAKDARIESLETRIDSLQEALDGMRLELHEIRTAT